MIYGYSYEGNGRWRRWGMGNPNKEPVEASKALPEPDWDRLAKSLGTKVPENDDHVLDKQPKVCYTITSGESLEEWKEHLQEALDYDDWVKFHEVLDKLQKV